MLKKSFRATIQRSPGLDASYVRLPFDLKAETGKGRMKVHATFDGVPYDGSIVNMGVKHDDGSVCYVLGMPKAVRKKTGKTFMDEVDVVIMEASEADDLGSED